jgi:hypothetical protein
MGVTRNTFCDNGKGHLSITKNSNVVLKVCSHLVLEVVLARILHMYLGKYLDLICFGNNTPNTNCEHTISNSNHLVYYMCA